MAGKTDFTEQEWESLQKGVTGSALLVSLADRSFFDTFKEVGALGKHLTEARKSSQSQLIQEVAEMHGTGFGLTASPDKVENETMEALQSAIPTLQAKAPEDVEAYKQFVLEVGQSVAAAAGEGDAAESEALEKIRGALQAA